MADFRRIKMSFILILGLQFLAETEQNKPSFLVRGGDEITLPCINVTDNQHECTSTSWFFSHLTSTSAVDLFTQGQMKIKSDQHSLTENCSLVIKNVTDKDVGRYFCQQQPQQRSPPAVDLSVINMIEHRNKDKVTLKCSLLTRGLACRHEVKWLFNGKDAGTDNNDLKTSQSLCSANVTFTTSHFVYASKNLLGCNVTNDFTKEGQLFTFNFQSSGTKKTESGNISTTTKEDWWWLYIVIPVGLIVLLVIVVAVIRCKRTKGNKRQTDGNVGLDLNPAVTQSGPGTTQHMADPEDGVSYASISYTKKANSKARVHRGGGDEGDAVTYSTVKASSASAGASADPSNLYATVN